MWLFLTLFTGHVSWAMHIDYGYCCRAVQFFTYSGLAKTNSFVMLAFTLIVFNSAKHICLLVTTSCFFFLFVFLMFVGTSLSYSCLCYI